MTFREILHYGERVLLEAGIEDARADAWYLMENVFGISRSEYLLSMQEQADPAALCTYEELVQRRKSRIPLQHILGKAWFGGLCFRVTEDVLIPRPETELLVEEALAFLDRCRKTQETELTRQVLDLCTGSGCIAICLSLRQNYAAVSASDISEKALCVAKENAAASGADVHFIQSDLFGDLPGRYCMIVSNPPYIPRKDIEDLAPEVRLHDPRTALDGGEDGLDFYRRIILEAPQHLVNGGGLLLEIGSDQAEAVSGMLERRGFSGIRVCRDLAGHDRVVQARLERKYQERN